VAAGPGGVVRFAEHREGLAGASPEVILRRETRLPLLR